MTSVAIIGTGIAGLGCAHLLKGRFKVVLFEKENRIGGHSNTVEVEENGQRLPVDTGFMVFNKITYPNLVKLFEQLDVPIKPTTMSFSVQHLPSGLEWNGAGLNRLFAQRRNLLRPRFWKLLLTINRFNKEAPRLLEDPAFEDTTLRELAQQRGYGEDFLHHYLIPMGAAVWSTPPARMLDFPAMTLMRFWKNHGFLGLDTHFQWWTIEGGSREYVKRLIAPFRDSIRTREAVVSVRRLSDGRAEIVSSSGQKEIFDRVILACHADEALALLDRPDEEERNLLSLFEYQNNTAIIHTEVRFMPKRRLCWASWNYRIEVGADGAPLPPTVHYWMNSLQGVSKKINYFVSLNVQDQIDPEKILHRIEYTHPLFSTEAVHAQTKLPALNRRSASQAVFFCGSYFKYGFHEDALSAGLDAARAVTGDESLSL